MASINYDVDLDKFPRGTPIYYIEPSGNIRTGIATQARQSRCGPYILQYAFWGDDTHETWMDPNKCFLLELKWNEITTNLGT